jgi:hypothetical protein
MHANALPRTARRRLPAVEELEPRIALSVVFPPANPGHPSAHGLAKAAARGGAVGLRLNVVAAHEVGHSLGLGHVSNPKSILYPAYNPDYDLDKLADDPVVPALKSLYADVDTSPWKDDLDGKDDGVIDLTYSFMPTDTPLDSGQTNIELPVEYQDVFRTELERWADVLNDGGDTKITFSERDDLGDPLNYVGASQNDPDSGDIRIGAHKMDRAGGTLAHAYYPPPNGSTAAGDTHIDSRETWLDAEGNPLPSLDRVTGGGGRGNSNGNGTGNDTGNDNGNGNQDSALIDPATGQVALGVALAQRQGQAGPVTGSLPRPSGQGIPAGQPVGTSQALPTLVAANTGSGALVGALPAAALSGASRPAGSEEPPEKAEKPMPESPEAPAKPPEKKEAPKAGPDTPKPASPDGPAQRMPGSEATDALFQGPAETLLPLPETVLPTSGPGRLPLGSLTELAVVLGGCWHLRPVTSRDEERA